MESLTILSFTSGKDPREEQRSQRQIDLLRNDDDIIKPSDATAYYQVLLATIPHTDLKQLRMRIDYRRPLKPNLVPFMDFTQGSINWKHTLSFDS